MRQREIAMPQKPFPLKEGAPKSPTNRAAAEIMEILLGLPSPRHAAAAVATVRANLFIQAGATSPPQVSRMMSDDDKAAMEIWETIARTHILD
jgi:hypothetical protein